MFATTILGFTLSTVWLIIVLVAWIFIALWPAMIASRKGHSFFGYFILSLFFWWITIFVALLLKDKNQPTVTSSPPPVTQ